MGQRDRLVLVGFLVPALAWLLFAQGYQLLYSLYLSFQDWALTTSDTPQGFVGLDNYGKVLHDPHFLQAMRLSALFLLSVSVELLLGFLLALATAGEGRGTRVIRTFLIVPMIIAPIAVGAIWRLLLDSNSGIVNVVLRSIGLSGPDWLGGQETAVVAVIAADVWSWIPFSMIIYSAALTGIGRDVLESAQLDGASRWKLIRYIYFPMTLPATLLICVFRLIDAFLVIDIVYSLTFGGPGFATNTMTLWLYNHGLRYFDLSQAAAGSWILLVICVGMAFAILRLKSRVDRRITGE